MPDTKLRFEHSPILDGMRAIAITVVVVSHASGLKFMPGGLGVTIFFFLSGFLITSLLRVEITNYEKVNFLEFYIKRFCRINLPLWGVMLFIGVALTVIGEILSPMHVTSQAMLFSNYYEYFTSSLSERNLAGSLPIPLWSLAVEEHFYLAFPIFAIGSVRLGGFSLLQKAIIFLLILVPLLRIWHFTILDDGDASYYLSHTRADAILWGSLLAVRSNPILDKADSTSGYFVTLAVLLLLVSLLVRNEFFRETIRYSLQSVSIMVMLRWCIGHPASFISRVMSSSVFATVAKYSYTLYLVHYFAIVMVHKIVGNVFLAFVASISISWLLAVLAHIAFERPAFALRGAMLRRSSGDRRVYLWRNSNS